MKRAASTGWEMPLPPACSGSQDCRLRFQGHMPHMLPLGKQMSDILSANKVAGSGTRSLSMRTDAVFVDCGDTVALDLPLPEGTSASDVQVSGGADYLVIRARNPTAPPLLSVVQLYSTVSPSDTRTEAPADGRLRVILRKLDASLRWPSLEAQDEPQVRPSPPDMQLPAANADSACFAETPTASGCNC